MRIDARLAAAPATVAVIDSGVDGARLDDASSVVGAARFWGADASPLTGTPAPGAASLRSPVLPTPLSPIADPLGHGTDVARLILAAAPRARLLSAQVFADHQPIAADTVAAAIEWAVAQGAQLINLSLGLREDRWSLRHACAAAQAAGVLLIASAPARGGPVFPAAYPGVVAVTGDARCAPGQWSLIEARPLGATFADGLLIGVSPQGPSSARESNGPRLAAGGASFAAARLCGMAAAWWASQSFGTATAAAATFLDHLAAGATYLGRERHVQEHAA